MTTTNAGAAVQQDLTEFITRRTGAEPEAGQDLFATGAISSMFAMELVVHLEDTHDIEILGPELSRDNFRSVQAMTAMVLRLRAEQA